MFWKKVGNAHIAALFIGFITLLAIAAPWITHFSYSDQNASETLLSPSRMHWCGTDSLGRDLFSRLLYGARVSLGIGCFTALFSAVFGTIYGSLSAYAGGYLDAFLMRIGDILYSLPSILLTVLIMLVVGRGPLGIFVAIAVVGWVSAARIARGQVLQAKELPYVEAAKSLGLSTLRILFKHILPNILPPILVNLSFEIPQNILSESFLSFVGLGLAPPYASWGSLANEGWRAYRTYPHLIFFPALILFVTILAFQVLGDALRVALDPQSRK